MKKNCIEKVIKLIEDSQYRFFILDNLGFYNKIDDKKFLKKKYRTIMGQELNLNNPQSFNEKLQWLKLYNRSPEYAILVDKYKVREYVAKNIGEEYLIPLLGVWDYPEEINFNALPKRFVLKCNHNSGLGMCICKDKSELNIKMVKKQLRKGLKQDYYLTGREWPYKNVERKIICEKYMEDNDNKIGQLTDYKFFCFNGYVDCVMVCTERQSGEPKFYFFDREWKLLRYNIRGKEAPKDFTIEKPKRMNDMFKIAEKLSKNLTFIRVDLYCCNEKIYFGELTFFPDSGFDKNLLPETDIRWGNMINLKGVK